MSEDDIPDGVDTGGGYSSSIYDGGHRITRREARAYASLLDEEIDELKKELSGEYARIDAEMRDIRDDAEAVLREAKTELDQGGPTDAVVKTYAPQIETLRHRAEAAMAVDDENVVHRIQRKMYKWERWNGIIESNDRGSVNAQEYSMRTNTVREQFRKMEVALETLKGKYLGQQEFVDYLEGVRNRLPSYLADGQDRNIEWTAEQLEDYLDTDDMAEAVERLQGTDNVNDETLDSGSTPPPTG